MAARLLPALLGITLLTGCAAQDVETALPLDHPANPAAAVASVPARSATLRAEPVPAGVDGSAPAAPARHEHGAMRQDDGSSARGNMGEERPGTAVENVATEADHADEHSAHPADGEMASKAPPSGASAADAVYVCPMHKEVTSDKAGKCPKCKMKLKAKPKKPVGAGARSASPSSDAAAAGPAASGDEGHDAHEGHGVDGGNK